MKLLITLFLAMSAAALQLGAQVGAQLGEGVVTGQILKIDGAPAAGIRVMAMEVGGVGVSSFASLAETDKDGRYRLDRLPPGRYYILSGLVETPTYYPGVLNRMDATVVSITRAVPTAPINFQLVKLPGVLVSGRVSVEDPAAEIIDVFLMREGSDSTPRAVSPERDGSFEFRNVLPGNYRAAVRAVSRTTSAVTISVLDKDIENLELTLTRPVKIHGRVVMEDRGNVPSFRFQMESKAFGLISGPIRPGPDGTFNLELPEKLRFELNDYPSSYAVKSITYGPTDLLKEPVKASDAEMVITFALKH
jgi:hypothetical protein